MPNWRCARCTQPTVWMMTGKKTPAKKKTPPKKTAKKITLAVLLRRIDRLRETYQDISKEQDTEFRAAFLDLLKAAQSCFPATDFLCYLAPKNRRPLFINGIVQNRRYEDKRIGDGFAVMDALIVQKTPLLVSGKFDDLPLRTKEGAFLGLPVFDHKMTVQGGFICYTRKTDAMTDAHINGLHVLAVALAALIRHQTAAQLISPAAREKQRDGIAPQSGRRRQNTASYRRDREKKPVTVYTPRATHITGTAFGSGIGIGSAVLHGAPQDIAQYAAGSKKVEEQALEAGIARLIAKNEEALKTQERFLSKEAVECLKMHQMLLRDPMWLDQIKQGVALGLSAPAAVEFARQKTWFALAKIADPYLRDRFSDISDLSDKLRLALEGEGTEEAPDGAGGEIVLVAHSLGVSGLMEYDMRAVRGIILESGSISSHISIIAATMDIPILGQAPEAMLQINPGDKVIIDSDQSVAFVLPEAPTLRLYKRKKAQMRQRERYLSLLNRHGSPENITRDGVKIHLYMNAGLPSEMPLMHDYGAAGIGLFRTELTFMGWTRYPSVATQADMYKKVLDQAGADKPVLFRTLDIGGDKPLPYFDAPEEENPALGWRAVRIGLDRPAILRTQFSAFLRAAGDLELPLSVMVPLVTEAAEIRQIRSLLDSAAARLEAAGQKLPTDIRLGVMLEVPALLWQLDAVCRNVDFISVGTNDLMQYLFAADRGSALMYGRYDFLSPPMLRVMRQIVETCDRHGTHVNVCGEAAAQPLEAMAMAALGYRNLSMPGARIPLMRNMCAGLDIAALKPYIERLMQTEEHSLRNALLAFAQDRGIGIF